MRQSMKNVRVLLSGKNNRTGRCPKRTIQVTEVQHVVTKIAAQHDNGGGSRQNTMRTCTDRRRMKKNPGRERDGPLGPRHKSYQRNCSPSCTQYYQRPQRREKTGVKLRNRQKWQIPVNAEAREKRWMKLAYLRTHIKPRRWPS